MPPIKEKTKSNAEGCEKLLEYTNSVSNSLVFANLVDFDVYFGHRNNPEGFYEALKEFDNFLPSFLSQLDESDIVLITADHGNDPTTQSTDHSREFVPLIVFRKNKKSNNLGIRETFSDAGKTVSDFFAIDNAWTDNSFLISM